MNASTLREKENKMKTLIALVVIAMICSVPAMAHRDANPLTNLVMLPGTTCVSNGDLASDYIAAYAIANVPRDGDPQYAFVKSCWHSTDRTGQAAPTLTITFPYAVTFHYIAWNSGATAGDFWNDDGVTTQVWSAKADGVTIVDNDPCDTGGVGNTDYPYLHDPCGPAPDGTQDERVYFAPVTATTLELAFTPINRAGGLYWSVRDINVGVVPEPSSILALLTGCVGVVSVIRRKRG